jgi:hypothetical protein
LRLVKGRHVLNCTFRGGLTAKLPISTGCTEYEGTSYSHHTRKPITGAHVIIGRCPTPQGKGVCGWLRERAYVLALVVIVVVVLAVSGLAFYAMYRSKPSRLKLTASLLKLASFSIEVESQDGRQGGKLPPGGGGEG